MLRRRPGAAVAAAAFAVGLSVAGWQSVRDHRRADADLEARLSAAARALAPGAARLFAMPVQVADAEIRRWAVAGGVRVTLVAPDGQVHADSWTLPELLGRLDNHADRPEVRDAAAGRVGLATRRSATTARPLLYVAVVVGERAAPAGFLRLARERPGLTFPWSGAFLALAAAFAAGAVAQLLEGRHHRAVARHLSHWSELPARAELAALAEDADRAFRARWDGAERELEATRAALAEVEEGVVLIDGEGEVQFANPAAGALLGPALQPGRRLAEGVRAPELLGAVAAVLAGEPPRHTSVAGANGAELAVRVRALDHPVLAAAVVLRDMRGERRLERARRALVADLAHELRTPLTVLSAAAEELQGEGVELAAVLERQVKRLRRFAEELEELAAIEAGRLALEVEEVELSAVAREVLADLAAEARAGGVSLALEGGPAVVASDPVRLAQVLTNLVANGVRFNRAGGRVTVRVGAQPDGAVLTVEDDGPGIPEADIPLVFQRFYRVRRSAQPPGSGLGLAIVKHLVKALGGTVQLSSREGEGTRVEVRVPRS